MRQTGLNVALNVQIYISAPSVWVLPCLTSPQIKPIKSWRRRWCHESRWFPADSVNVFSFVETFLKIFFFFTKTACYSGSSGAPECQFHLITSIYMIPAGPEIIFHSLSGAGVGFLFFFTESQSERLWGERSPYSAGDWEGMWLLFRWK